MYFLYSSDFGEGDGPDAAQAARFLRLFDAIRPDVVTARYNLLSPLYAGGETDIFAFARRHGIGVLIKQALGQGLLLGSHHPHIPAPIRARFGDRPADLARVALRYALQHAPDAVVLVGFRNANQIHTTLTCLGDPLRPEEIDWIRGALHTTPNTPTEREGQLT